MTLDYKEQVKEDVGTEAHFMRRKTEILKKNLGQLDERDFNYLHPHSGK